MPTTRESVLAALQARLQPLAAPTLRDEVLPERIPASGLIILRDGQPGEPEVTLSPLRYHYQHRAEFEVVVQAGSGRADAFDDLIASVGGGLAGAFDKGGFAPAIPVSRSNHAGVSDPMDPCCWPKRKRESAAFMSSPQVYRRRTR